MPAPAVRFPAFTFVPVQNGAALIGDVGCRHAPEFGTAPASEGERFRIMALARRPKGVADTTSSNRRTCSPLRPRAAPGMTLGRSWWATPYMWPL
jgi:hypothetical protein